MERNWLPIHNGRKFDPVNKVLLALDGFERLIRKVGNGIEFSMSGVNWSPMDTKTWGPQGDNVASDILSLWPPDGPKCVTLSCNQPPLPKRKYCSNVCWRASVASLYTDAWAAEQGEVIKRLRQAPYAGVVRSLIQHVPECYNGVRIAAGDWADITENL